MRGLHFQDAVPEDVPSPITFHFEEHLQDLQ